jgi:hypothetical protein
MGVNAAVESTLMKQVETAHVQGPGRSGKRVVEHDLDDAEALLGGVRQALQIFRPARIAGNGQSRTTALGDARSDSFHSFRGTGEEHDIGAGRGEGPGDLFADTRSDTRHDGGLPIEPEPGERIDV